MYDGSCQSINMGQFGEIYLKVNAIDQSYDRFTTMLDEEVVEDAETEIAMHWILINKLRTSSEQARSYFDWADQEDIIQENW